VHRDLRYIYSDSNIDPVNKIIGQKAKRLNDKPGSTESNNCVKS
jgi:hypothetical protein